MEFSLKYISEQIEGKLYGDPSIIINKIAPLESASDGDISFLANPRYKKFLTTTRASAVLVEKEIEGVNAALIVVKNPYIAFQKLITLFQPEKRDKSGIHETSVIDKSCILEENVCIGEFTVVENNCNIGKNTLIYPFVYLGSNITIGENCVIYPFVSIRENTVIGNNVILHSGTVIGSDGFGFAQVSEKHKKIPQIGNVVIEDNVEIGSNCSVDRAAFGSTVIHKGTKLDNLIQVAHNVEIGSNSVIASQTGISGSTKIGSGVMIGGQAGIGGHITVGDKSMIGGQAGVTKSVSSNTIVSGYPAREHKEAKRLEAYIRKLPELYKRIKELEKRIPQ